MGKRWEFLNYLNVKILLATAKVRVISGRQNQDAGNPVINRLIC